MKTSNMEFTVKYYEDLYNNYTPEDDTDIPKDSTYEELFKEMIHIEITAPYYTYIDVMHFINRYSYTGIIVNTQPFKEYEIKEDDEVKEVGFYYSKPINVINGSDNKELWHQIHKDREKNFYDIYYSMTCPKPFFVLPNDVEVTFTMQGKAKRFEELIKLILMPYYDQDYRDFADDTIVLARGMLKDFHERYPNIFEKTFTEYNRLREKDYNKNINIIM